MQHGQTQRTNTDNRYTQAVPWIWFFMEVRQVESKNMSALRVRVPQAFVNLSIDVVVVQSKHDHPGTVPLYD